MPQRLADFTAFARAIAIALLGALRRLPVRSLLLGLERAEPQPLPDPAVQRRRQVAWRRPTTRSCTRRRTRASRPATRRRRSRSARPRRVGATGACPVSPTRTRRASSQSSSPRPTRGSSSTRGRTTRTRSTRTRSPSQVVKWPNVSLASLPRFNESLKMWFKRKSAPIWITEYGHQTNARGRVRASHTRRRPRTSSSRSRWRRSYPFVGMFIWFVYQDDQGQPWESGLYRASGAPKGIFARTIRRQRATARRAKRGLQLPRGNARRRSSRSTRAATASSDTAGESIGMTWRIFRAGRLIAVGQQTAPLRIDCTIRARLRFRTPMAKGVTYTRDLRPERQERRRSQPPPDAPRHVAVEPGTPGSTRSIRAPASLPTTGASRAPCRRSRGFAARAAGRRGSRPWRGRPAPSRCRRRSGARPAARNGSAMRSPSSCASYVWSAS